MNLKYVPLLQLQRELHEIPRSMTRFREYLRVMVNETGDDLALPTLVLMNPMGGAHMKAMLDTLLRLGADRVAVRALEDSSQNLADAEGEFQVALVVADDVLGGWTNRYASEFTMRFGAGRRPRGNWITGVVWASEAPTRWAVREAILNAVYRTYYIHEHGPAPTLADMLAQEGYALAMSGSVWPNLEPADVDHTRQVLAPLLDATDKRTAIECLFGDVAAHSLGFTPRGLRPWAGIALALRDARGADIAVCQPPQS